MIANAANGGSNQGAYTIDKTFTPFEPPQARGWAECENKTPPVFTKSCHCSERDNDQWNRMSQGVFLAAEDVNRHTLLFPDQVE